MRQLSGADSMFLQFERGNNFMHVASLAIYDPSTAPGGGVRFKDVLRLLRDADRAVPAVPPPAGLVAAVARPPVLGRGSDSIDVEFHVRHIAVPHPGDWRQLCIQVARLHSRPLDRSKPLWEAYVIEGLHNVPGVPPGSFALYTQDASRDRRRRIGHRDHAGAAFADAGTDRFRRRGTQRERGSTTPTVNRHWSSCTRARWRTTCRSCRASRASRSAPRARSRRSAPMR